MLVYLIYTVLLVGLILWNRCFGLFADRSLSKRFLVLLFVGKALAVPVFFEVYKKTYGGIENFDAGKFCHDVRVIAQTAKTHPSVFFRIMSGVQNDAYGSDDYEKCLKYTVNWDNGTVKDYLYNDNRVLIRTHVVLDFLSFGSYLAHGLFSSFFSLIGAYLIYLSIKNAFPYREKWLLLVFCFFPALWFYSGALLKEGICIFVMGWSMRALSLLFIEQKLIRGLLFFLPALIISSLLKPYLLLSFSFFSLLYFAFMRLKHKGLRFVFFGLVLSITFFAVNLFSIQIKQRSLIDAALEHQKRFKAVANGGLFLSDSLDYVQLPADSGLVSESPTREGMLRIKKGVAFMYWKAEKPTDTLYCFSNSDTIKEYGFIYFISPSRSNIQLNQASPIRMAISALYYSTCFPLFFNAKGPLQWLASVENLLVLLSVCIIAIGTIRTRRIEFFVFVFFIFAIFVCLLVGITAPNSGAIFRYRAPALVFVLVAALNYLPYPWFDKLNRQ